MHGELLEFNENLQKTVQVLEKYSCQLLRTTYLINVICKMKDAALIRLREELVRVRGPLPEDGEDTASLSSQDTARWISQNSEFDFKHRLWQLGGQGAGQHLDTLCVHHWQWGLKAPCLSGSKKLGCELWIHKQL